MNALAAAAPPPSDTTSTYVILGAGGLFLIYVMQRMTKRKPTREPENTFFTKSSLAQERRAQNDMENVLVELSKMSRELSAQLDTRAAKLDALIADADERAARLEVLLKQAPARPDFGRPDPARPDFGRPDYAASAVEPLMKLVHPPAATPADDMAPSPTIDAGHAEVYRLADEGKTVGQIAGDLGRPSGEVELILALRPRS